MVVQKAAEGTKVKDLVVMTIKVFGLEINVIIMKS